MKKIILSMSLLFFNLGFSQRQSDLFSDTKKLSYFVGYSSVNYEKFSVDAFPKYNNSSTINLGVNYRFFNKDNYQFTVTGILNYSTLEYKINDALSNTGSELFLDIPVKFEYNIGISDKFFITPNAGLNFSAYLNSQNKYFQNYYFSGNSFDTHLQTKPYSVGGVIGADFSYKTDKGVFGLAVGYSKALNNTYDFSYSNTSTNSVYSQSLKRDFFTIGLKFTPKK